MRKIINTAALIVFIWLVIDTFQIHNYMLSVLLVGAIPGTNLTLPPFLHLAFLTAIATLFIIEITNDNFRISKRIHHRFTHKTPH